MAGERDFNKRFCDYWEQRKLGDLGTTFTGLSGKTKEDFGHGAASFVTYMNVFLNPVADAKRVESVEIDKTQNTVRYGDVFFTTSSETPEEVGMSSVWLKNTEDTYLNSFCFGYRPTAEIDPYYMAYMLRSESVRKKIIYLAQGISRYNISKNGVMQIEIPIPNNDEQKSIGKYFKHLDNLITLHQCKYYHHRIGNLNSKYDPLPPNNTVTWEQRKFGDVGSVSMCKRIFKDETSPEGEIPFYKIGTFGGEADAYISRELFEDYRAKFSYPKNGDILLSASGTIGRIVEYTGEDAYFQDSNIVWLSHDDTISNKFLKVLYPTLKWDGIEGSTIQRLYNDNFLRTQFKMPEYEEQEALGDFFSNLDSIITLHQCKHYRPGIGYLNSKSEPFPPYNTVTWEQRKVADILVERNEQAPKSVEYPLMAFIANEGVAPKGDRYDRSSLVNDTEGKLYKKTEYGDFIYSSNNLETGSIGLNKYGNASISPVYSIFHPTELADSNFIGRRLVRKDFIQEMVKWRQGVIYGQWRIHESDFLKIEIPVPTVEEQRLIGALLDSLDNLITLHQGKYYHPRIGDLNSKSDPFPPHNAATWEQRKLSDLATMHARIGWQNLRTSEFLDEGDYMLITGTDFDDGRINYETCHYIEQGRYDQDPHIQIHDGSILITKDGTLGKVAYVQSLTMPATLNAGVFNVEIEDEDNTDGKYLFQFLKAPFLMDYVNQRATGGTIKHLNQNILVDFPVLLPSKAEQEIIGRLFEQLDTNITLHQCKHYRPKTGGLSSKFDPFLPHNTATWEQRKLSDVADKVIEKNNELTVQETFTNSAEFGVISQRDFFDHDISNADNIGGYYVVRDEDFVYNPRISVTAPVGPVNRNKMGRNGVMSPLYTVFRTHDIDTTYLEWFFKSSYWHPFMFFNGDSGARSDRFSIKDAVFFEMPIPMPRIEEQRQIGAYMDKLDNLITLHQRRYLLLLL